MPLYEYVCNDCRAKFETLVRRWGDRVDCPGCGSGSVEKQLSTFAVASSQPPASGASASCGMEAGGCGATACGGGFCGMPN
jgi:putative FmdB family regulatory protein